MINRAFLFLQKPIEIKTGQDRAELAILPVQLRYQC